MSRSEFVDLSAELVHETAGARLFNFELADEVWLAKSVHEWDEFDKVVTLRKNMAIQKGLV